MQAALIESIGKHLDALESLFNAVIVLAVIVAWAGIRRTPEIEALGTKVEQRYGFFAMATLYLIANMTVLILFLRLGDLLALLDSTHAPEGIWKLATHSWVLSPFSYFGNSGPARVYCAEGYGLLIVVWWLCNASLSTLVQDKRSRVAKLLLGLFVGIGLGSMLAIQRTQAAALDTLFRSDRALHAAVTDALPERAAGTFLGVLVGAVLFVGVNALQVRWVKWGAS